jgi:hypothetical protein
MLTNDEHQAWIARGPRNSRFRDVVLRMVAMRMRYVPEGHWKFVVQPHGFPEEPLVSEYLTAPRIEDYLSSSLKDGWSIEVDPSLKQLEIKNADRHAYNMELQRRQRAAKRN